ncbi:transglycosylase domain-containing protein [Peribacillus sp. NPDC097295]|uniref:transglycosylase domain-containing protein n=1 Tax=Peribacillus sp. NPDC097295 TaxID=3364402 RepID=UPI00380FB220
MKGLLKIGLIILSIIVVVGVGLFIYFKQTVDISNLQDQLQQPTKIYDEDGNVASTITANKSEGVAIEEIPDHVIQAVVSIEDHRFYEHHGIDYQAITRAMVKNVKAKGVVEGGSTLTQQLVKITMLESDRTLKRKIEEFFIAQEMESTYTKDEILEMYVNQVYFGHGAWGLKKAANIYFSKDVSELTIAEGALLAGVINLPSKLDPYKNPDGAVKRRDLVLSRMTEHGYLTEKEATSAKKEKLSLLLGENTDPLKGKYPYYVDHVLSEATSKYGLELQELLTRGYKIHTTLNQPMQQAAETVYSEDGNFPAGTSDDKLVQSGTVLLQPKTGGIKALVGGRGEHQFMGYNRATQLKRSPGSSIKPLVAYTPAIEEGYEITDSIKDEKMKFGNYEPTNLNGTYKGEVPMYEAVMNSLNVPTVWLLNEIGIDKGLDSLKRFGIPYEKNDRNLSIALGGMEKGVSPLQMAGAFSAFANEGNRYDAHAIIKIEDADGKEIAVWKEKKTKVTSKDVVDKMNAMLLGTVKYGTAENAAVTGYEVAGKTGSTQVPIEGISGVKDQWFVGYTPNLVGAVWAGYDKTDKKHHLTTHSSQGSAIIFQKIMAQALKNETTESFHAEDIGPLIAEQKEKEEEEERKQYWIDKGNEIKEGLGKWKSWDIPW